jgi:hypothetical protein
MSIIAQAFPNSGQYTQIPISDASGQVFACLRLNWSHQRRRRRKQSWLKPLHQRKIIDFKARMSAAMQKAWAKRKKATKKVTTKKKND